ncbi:hemolysin family protein [Streptomyces sp. ACA25]|uniref:hemolysin family protein n=1 Tax=Streptomyces sp. ACA25 TaxID=3022596 RepID=UPI00230836A3|nr:hemolysin family protein [Streptomyces sp. ACA25]MDB1086161.1 hemolysin family protein [Streptomyces sp. ACA25]
MNPLTTVLITVALLIGSGFFVAAEFALVAARHHRMEQAAAEGRRGARSALAGMREVSLMLAGAQLGITACTLGLGSFTKPAVSQWVEPLFLAVGLPTQLSYGVSFVLAMVLVVFLHMVVGEMAPKSWAISHPERSAMLLAPPFRALVKVVRPFIWVLNKVGNTVVRMCRVTPRGDLSSVHSREQLTHLVAESHRLGLINETDSGLITRSLTEPQTPVGALQVPAESIVSVPAHADTHTILAVAAAGDHPRLLVREGQQVLGSVHARDAMVARAQGREVRAAALARAVPRLTADDTIAHAVEQLRHHRASLAVVHDADGRLTGLISLDDLLVRLIVAQPQPG